MPTEHGDIVAFRDPGAWLAPTVPPAVRGLVGGVDAVLAFVGLSAPDCNDHLVKRVVGLTASSSFVAMISELTVSGVQVYCLRKRRGKTAKIKEKRDF